MSSDRLVEELKAVKKATEYRVEAAMAIANGRSLLGTNPPTHDGKTAVAPGIRTVVNTARGGQFVIEDKRNRTKAVKTTKKAAFQDLVEGTSSIPYWARMPNVTKLNGNGNRDH